MVECRLLYSKIEMEDFLRFPYCEECKLYSLYLDGQKVFIVVIESKQAADTFDAMYEESHPTLLGCIDTDRVKLTLESLRSLKVYIRKLEQKEDLVAFSNEVFSGRQARY